MRLFRPRSKPRIEVELYTKPGCHLCNELKRTLERSARGMDVRVKETDISRDDELLQDYGDDVPVLFVNGRKAFKHRVSERELRRRLRLEVGR